MALGVIMHDFLYAFPKKIFHCAAITFNDQRYTEIGTKKNVIFAVCVLSITFVPFNPA